MAEIQVNSEALRSTASQLKSRKDNFDQIASDFSQNLNSLSGVWEGEAFNNFKTQLDSLQPSLESYSKVIMDYANFLETAAEQYEQTEQTTTSETENLVNNLFK